MHALSGLGAIVGLWLHAAPQATCSDTASTVHARIGGQSIPLGAAELRRLPYGMDITLEVRVDRPLTALSVRYMLRGAPDGPRSGTITGASVDPCTWRVAFPRLRLNESGTISLERFSKPAPAIVDSIPVRLLRALHTLPARIEVRALRDAVAATASAAIDAVRPASDTQRVVVRAIDGSSRPLADVLADDLAIDLATLNVVSDLGNALGVVADRARNIRDVAGVVLPTQRACPPGSTVADVEATARALVDGGEPAILDAIARRELPWPSCVRALFRAVEARNSASEPTLAASQATAAIAAISRLESNEALVSLAALVERVESLAERSLAVSSLSVPFGASMLDRYTQTDLMTIVLPGESQLVQPFVTASLYLFRGGVSPQLTAPVEPAQWFEAARFAVQFGYPFGSPLQAPDVPTDPRYLVGLQYRLNALLSVSAGAVFAKVKDVNSRVFYVGTNVDVSNLGPLQQLFARRDPP